MTTEMKHYKDPETGAIYAYAADGSDNAFIPPGLVPLSDYDLAALMEAAIDHRSVWKVRRAQLVAAIKVTTSAGHTFDGDEQSQGRMARAILGLQSVPGGSVTWVLADNSVQEVGAAELTEALTLAGAEQARLWVAV